MDVFSVPICRVSVGKRAMVLIFTRFERVIEFKKSLNNQPIHDDNQHRWHGQCDDCFEHRNNAHHLTPVVIGQTVVHCRFRRKAIAYSAAIIIISASDNAVVVILLE